jgi:lipopolysaccharide/colanic/teichoic acid biosynthesis glycosyltransferase
MRSAELKYGATEEAETPCDPSLADEMLSEKLFHRMLSLERKRAERSHGRFVLMLLESGNLLDCGHSDGRNNLNKVVKALAQSIRETDARGWYKNGSTIGVIFTEVGSAPGAAIANAILKKLTNALCSCLTIEQINQISLSLHVYPESPDFPDSSTPTDTKLYPDLLKKAKSDKLSLGFKRIIDIFGALALIVVLAPLFVLIALLIKLTSKGPVLFRQERLGQYGRRFTFLKFRSMYFANDSTIHKEYVTRYIAGRTKKQDKGIAIYKITNDPRVTPIGRLLRRTSLDELPQFFNVLCGEMSLVGPRPPVPYEFAAYDSWHRTRLLAVKPGITGLWQVEGRSRVEFDDMVRLDLRYASAWSLWLDIKILLKTPKAVLVGEGAF